MFAKIRGGMLIFGATTPGLEKDKIRTGCYSCGSVTFGKFALSCVAALCVCAWDGHQNTGAFGKKRPNYMPFPMPNTQTFRSRITQAKAVPGRCWDRPPTSDPKGGPVLYWLWATCTHKAEKFRGGVKTARPVQRTRSRSRMGIAKPPPSGFRFPLGNWRPRGGLTKRLPRAHEGFLCIPGMLANCLLFTFGIAIPKLPNAWEFGSNLAGASDPTQLPPPGGPTVCPEGETAPRPG